MPVLLRTPQGSSLVVAAQFSDENELQTVIADSPTLLCADEETPVVLVQREVTLPEAGHLDLLLVTSKGLPVAVEAKLFRNGESRREVVAQVVDYVSALTQMTVEELDQAVSGALDAAVKKLEQLYAPGSFEQIWQQIGVNLRAGVARVVLVLDQAPADLERIVRFLAERSSLDVRLVVVSKFNDPNHGTLYVPGILVNASEERTLRAPPSLQGPKAELQAVVSEYDAKAPAELRTRGRAAHYRQFRPTNWPWAVHYEFIQTSQEIGAELHLEDDKVKFLASPLSKLHGTKLSNGAVLVWDPRWVSNRGRLMVKYPVNEDAAVVAQTMHALIAATRALVDQALLDARKDLQNR